MSPSDDEDPSLGDVTDGDQHQRCRSESATPPQLHTDKPKILDTLWSKLAELLDGCPKTMGTAWLMRVLKSSCFASSMTVM